MCQSALCVLQSCSATVSRQSDCIWLATASPSMAACSAVASHEEQQAVQQVELLERVQHTKKPCGALSSVRGFSSATNVLTPRRHGLLASTRESLSVCPGIAINKSSLVYLKASLWSNFAAVRRKYVLRFRWSCCMQSDAIRELCCLDAAELF